MNRINHQINTEKRDTYWDRRINIAHRKINRKKYYGVGVEIENYVDKVRDAVDVSKAVNYLKSREAETAKKEALIDDAAMMVSVKSLSDNPALYSSISAVFGDSFQKGTRRLFTKSGDRVDVDQFTDESAISGLMNKQDDYFQKLSEDVGNKTRDTLRQGLEEGKSMQEMGKELEQNVDEFTRNRADTIARSEVIKASSKGTEATMDKAGVDEFMWLSARDSRVCKAEDNSWSENFNGTTYRSCRDYDGETFHKDMNHPMPVRDSHPNCRCTMVANVD